MPNYANTCGTVQVNFVFFRRKSFPVVLLCKPTFFVIGLSKKSFFTYVFHVPTEDISRVMFLLDKAPGVTYVWHMVWAQTAGSIGEAVRAMQERVPIHAIVTKSLSGMFVKNDIYRVE